MQYEYNYEEALTTTSPEQQLIFYNNKTYWSWISRNPNLVSAIQLKMAKNTDFCYKCNLAMQYSLIPEAQQVLSQVDNSMVQFCLLSNPCLIPELFPVLSLKLKNALIKHQDDINYHNPKTQSLFEKFLLLV